MVVYSRIVFVLFVLLSKKALTLQDSSSYFSVMVFGRLVVLVKRQLDIFMVSALLLSNCGVNVVVFCKPAIR